MKYEMGLKGGMLVTCPIPEAYEIPYDKMDGVINAALEKSRQNNVKGKEITPFLLDEVKKLTDGSSLEANIKLVLNNADIGSRIGKVLED